MLHLDGKTTDVIEIFYKYYFIRILVNKVFL